MSFHAFSALTSHLSLAAPDVLDEAVTLGQSVQGIVGLAHGADETAEGVDVVLAGDGAARLVNLGDGDLDGGVVLGLDDAVGGRALAGDVAVWSERCGLASLVPPMNACTCIHFRSPFPSICSRGSEGICPYRSTISPRSFSILAVVLGGCLGERVEGGFVGGQEGRPVEVSVSPAVGDDGVC